MRERPVTAVPPPVIAVMVATLLIHMAWQATRTAPAARAETLTPPYRISAVRVLSGDEVIVAAQVSALYLQAFDNQPGISVPFRELDYSIVERWLDLMLELDPRTHYPLMMASQLYSQVPDAAKQRLMLDLVHRGFLADPERRWRWLAHAAILAKHRLKDLPRALRYADDLARHAPRAPSWVRHMRIFILEDMGEREAAMVLLGGLLEGGEVMDPHEIRFLSQRLQSMKDAEIPSAPSRN